jgi:ABC-type sugar transport system, permease component
MRRLASLLSYICISVLAVLWLFPVILVLMNSFKTLQDFSQGGLWHLPEGFAFFQNVRDAWVLGGLGQGFLNSIAYGVIGAVCSILLAALASYGLVIMQIKRAFFWFLLIYSGTIFPFQMYLIPLYMAYRKTGLFNSFGGLALFYIAICIPFCVFLLRNFMRTLPYEVVEAARIEGCSNFTVFWKIVMPMCLSPIYVLFIFQFTWIWNDLIFGLTLTQSPDIRPIMAGLSSMQGIFFRTGVTTLMAGVIITSIPTILVFFLLQKSFIKGLQLSVKG